MKYFQLILWGLFFAGSIVLFVRFNRRMRRDYYLKTAIKAVLKKQQQLPGRSFFSTYVLAQALFPLLKSRKKEEAKTREALIKGNLLTAERYFRKKRQPTLAAGLKAFYHPQKALEELEKIAKAHPQDNIALILTAYLHFTLGQNEAVLPILDNMDISKASAYVKAMRFYLQTHFDMRDGDLQSAAENSSKAAKLFNREQAFYEEAAAHFVMGTVYRISTIQDVSQFVLQTAQKIYRHLGATKEEGEVLGTLGMLMVMQKRYDEADDYFNKAKELYKKTGQRQGCGEIINQEALAALIRQDYGAARKLAKQALLIHEEERNTAGQGFSLELIGSAYSREKKWKQVIRHARQAQELYAATHNNPARLEALYLEAQACFENNDDNEAETVLRKIINADKEQHSCFFVGNAYNLLGLIFMKKGDLRRAKGFFQQSLDCELRSNRAGGIAIDYANIALLEYKRGQTEQAVKTVETALEYAKAFGEGELYSQLKKQLSKIRE
ncbi:tetratricopeptide repeat family [Proteobacteria bacterium CAG:495]|nr:tetratricopeptide repeat family [Proteobacteria bacterium CAG:495]